MRADTSPTAKQLRAQYPGYREYIDQKVSEASGLPVANAYYKNLMQDINHQLMQIAGGNKDPIEALVMKNLDVPGITEPGIVHRHGPPHELTATNRLDERGLDNGQVAGVY